jgi:hypothetical protein
VDGSIDTAHIADDAINEHKLAAGAVVTAAINDDAVTTAKINANAVGLTELAGIARGKIIYGDSGGDPAVLTVGSADQVLTSDGTDISWAAAGGKIIGMKKVYWSQTNSSFTSQSGTQLSSNTYYPVGARIGGAYTKVKSDSHILVQGRICLGHSGTNLHGMVCWRSGKEGYYRNIGIDARNFNWYSHGSQNGAYMHVFSHWFDGATANDVQGTGSMTFYVAPAVSGTRTHSHELNFNPYNNTYGGDQGDTPNKTTVSEMIVTEFEA